MYLYTNEFYGNYEAGIIIVAARNAFRAMEIIREQNGDEYPDENLEVNGYFVQKDLNDDGFYLTDLDVIPND